MTGTEITMRRNGDVLVPTAEMFLEDLRSVPEGREVFVTIVMARSPQQHRFFFAMLNEIVKAGQWDGDVDSLLDWIKIGVGHVSHVISKAGGKVYYVLKSIAFRSMDQTRFQRFLKRVEWFLAERMGIDIGALRQHTVAAAGTVDAEPETKPTSFPDPLDTRLVAFATTLRKARTSEAVETVWSAQRSTAEVKALHQRVPEAVKAILDIAKMKGLGKISDEEFDEAVNKLIDKAVEGIAA